MWEGVEDPEMRSDGGGKFVMLTAKDNLTQWGVEQQFTPPKNQESNRIAETDEPHFPREDKNDDPGDGVASWAMRGGDQHNLCHSKRHSYLHASSNTFTNVAWEATIHLVLSCD